MVKKNPFMVDIEPFSFYEDGLGSLTISIDYTESDGPVACSVDVTPEEAFLLAQALLLFSKANGVCL